MTNCIARVTLHRGKKWNTYVKHVLGKVLKIIAERKKKDIKLDTEIGKI